MSPADRSSAAPATPEPQAQQPAAPAQPTPTVTPQETQAQMEQYMLGMVQAAIQGDLVRVSGAKRDDLQAVMALLRKDVTELPLAFDNFRD